MKQMKRVLSVAGLALILGTPAFADTFVNGGFEDGNFGGWTQGYGEWTTAFVAPNPTDYRPGGSEYNAGTGLFGVSLQQSAIVGAGTDFYSGLSTVYNGSYAARINDGANNYSVNTAFQKVLNYTDNDIFFEWAAVLQGSHSVGDSDGFILQLTDDTTGQVLVNRTYDSASAAGSFNLNSTYGVYWSPWTVEHIDLTTAGAGGTSIVGHDFTLELLATDCPYSGHWGYVYLDGFGGVIVPPGVPEPASLALLGLGGLATLFIRRRHAAKQ